MLYMNDGERWTGPGTRRAEHRPGTLAGAEEFECVRCGYTVPDTDDPLLCATCARQSELEARALNAYRED